jgi:glycosyltransferase involved in cell wall biosynthesis
MLNDENAVSIGIPCYNRPAMLRKALDSVLAQTHTNLEIIVSDNASTDPDVEAVGREYAQKDSRVRFLRQDTNIGVIGNFKSVLQAATKPYFKWAADDDLITPDFVELCLKKFGDEGRPYALVSTETRYTVNGNFYKYFPQGEKLRNIDAPHSGMYYAKIFDGLFDNLIYGIFRREALFHEGKTLLDWIGTPINEHPLFALVATKGKIACIEQVCLYKNVTMATCLNADWETNGGRRQGLIPQMLVPHRRRRTTRYYEAVIECLNKAIMASHLDDADKHKTIESVNDAIRRNLKYTLWGFKPRVNL